MLKSSRVWCGVLAVWKSSMLCHTSFFLLTSVNLSVLVWHSFWEEGEPNNHIDEDCGYIVKTQVRSRVPTKSWYDAPCEMPCLFVCEMEKPPAGA